MAAKKCLVAVVSFINDISLKGKWKYEKVWSEASQVIRASLNSRIIAYYITVALYIFLLNFCIYPFSFALQITLQLV